MELGLGEPERFWKQTPRLFDIAVRGRMKALRRERDQRLTQAWYTALLTRVKDFPKLTALLSPDEAPPPRQTPEEIRSVVGQWLAVADIRNPQP